MSMKVNMLVLESIVTIEQMKNHMLKSIMMLIMTMTRRMGMREVATVIATTAKKVVLVVLWLMAALMLLPLAMEMADLVMLLKNACITKKNQSKKVLI
jgi:hypothetical protein